VKNVIVNRIPDVHEIAKRQDVLVRALLLPVTVKTKHVLRFPVPVVELAAIAVNGVLMAGLAPALERDARWDAF
jgi:hypothetical protein